MSDGRITAGVFDESEISIIACVRDRLCHYDYRYGTYVQGRFVTPDGNLRVVDMGTIVHNLK